MPVSYPIFNTDPNLQSQAALLDQRQMLAQALLQRGLTPMPGHMAGDVYVGPHPLEALGNLVSAWKGSEGIKQVAQDRASLASQAYAAQLQANEPQRPPSFTQPQVSSAASAALAGGGGPTNTNAQKMGQLLVGQQPADPGAPPNPRNPLNLPAELVTGYQAGYIPKEVFETQAALFKPTEATIQARQGGFDPTQANQQAFAKTVTDPTILKLRQAGFSDDQIKRFIQAEQIKSAEIDRKAGNQYYNFATGDSGMVPKIPENANPVGAVQSNGAVPGVAPIPGALPVTQANAGATEAGKAPFNIVEGFDPKIQAPVKNYAGNVMTPPGQVVPPKVQKERDQERLTILKQERAKPTNSAADNAALDREIASVSKGAGIQSGPALGEAAGAQAAQTELSNKWAKLNQDNTAAQTVIARLQTIKQLGPQAITGFGTERRDLMNGLLSLAGIKGAGDAKTASDLVDKNAAQIVSALRLGQGGAGTDALQAQLGQANPSRHMTMDAIKEAVDNLSAAQSLSQAKARLLQPHANARDPVAYQQKEQEFDSAADPRIFQLRDMDAQSAAQYLAKLPPQVQSELRQKAAKLKQMGVFNGS